MKQSSIILFIFLIQFNLFSIKRVASTELVGPKPSPPIYQKIYLEQEPQIVNPNSDDQLTPLLLDCTQLVQKSIIFFGKSML